MKRIFALLITLLLFATSANAQLNVWRWQNPLPEGNFLYSVQMMSPSLIYVCGDNGTFMSTKDSGAHWDIQNNVLNLKGTWRCLSFCNPNFGMCCGDTGKAIKTTDGGKTWALMPIGIKIQLNSVVVIDTNIALIVLLDGGIIKTTNGGADWFAIPTEGVPQLYSIRKLRTNFLYVTGYGGTVMTSIDTGNTWSPIRTTHGNTYFCASYTTDSIATVIGENTIVLQTSNAGLDWKDEIIDSFQISAALNYIDGKDPNIMTIVGNHGTIINTTNGGKDWVSFYTGTNEDIKCVSYFDKLHATAVGHDGAILVTSDGGQTWDFVPQIPEILSLYGVAFPKGDTSLGLAVGYSGVIMRTTNGGAEWNIIPSGTLHAFRAVAFADETTAIIVGDYGAILKSIDGGLTWKSMPSSTDKQLLSVSFATPTEGIACGDSVILKTNSAGDLWSREFLPNGADYFSHVSYPDKMHAFLTGFLILVRSHDGGINWDLIDNGAGPPWLYSFCDSLHGVEVYSIDISLPPTYPFYVRTYHITFTSDAGKTWYNDHWMTALVPKRIPYDVQCIDPMHTKIVGKGGYIGHTTDGGATWIDDQSNTLNDLYACGFPSLKAGNAVGRRGNIMRITTDEVYSSVRGESASAPGIIIEGNYPNPFTKSTTIKYSLPASGQTELKIFSIDGKEISSSPAEYQSSGYHTINFDATGLAPGTYIVRITSNGLSGEGKIVLE